jgi:hypothetical protein
MTKEYAWTVELYAEFDLDGIIETWELTADSDGDAIESAVREYSYCFDDDILYNLTEEVYEQVANDIAKLLDGEK